MYAPRKVKLVYSSIRRTRKVGRDIPFREYLKTRIVTPKELKAALDDPYPCCCIGELIFMARYIAGKAIEGYDFI